MFKADDYGYPLPAFYFKVTFSAKGDEDAAFQEVSGIGSQIETEPYAEGGENTFYEKAKEKDVKGITTWVIWSVPRSKDVIEETGYEKSLLFVRQDNFFVIRALHWVRDGGYKKYMDVKKLELIDGIWVATEMHITKKKGKNTAHKTILKLTNVKFNQGIEFDMFTVRRMEKGL